MIPASTCSPGLRDMFKELHKTRVLHEQHVFLHGGQPVLSLKGPSRRPAKEQGSQTFAFTISGIRL